LPALLAATAATAGCASLGVVSTSDAPALGWKDIRGSRGAVIRAEMPAPAPAGLAAFCERFAESCGEAQTAQAREDLFRAASWPRGEQPVAAWVSQPNEDGAAIFARMLQMRAQGLRFDYPRSEVELTEQLWRELSEVNQQVNRSIAAATDAARYGLNEYWAMPLSEAKAGETAQGDCEDYALEKRSRLIELGWDPASLALAVAHAPRIGNHAVLIVQTDHGDFVLDNLHDAPLPPQMLNYGWVSRQASPSMTVWASARVEFAPMIERPRDMLMASAERPRSAERPLLGPAAPKSAS
jgi:predicted transglutaminase-like cysteine proteinase